MPSTFNAVDPATGLPGAGYDEASAADVAAAVDAAGRAFHAPELRDRGARAVLLRGAAARLRAAGDEIVAVAGSETGLPEARPTPSLRASSRSDGSRAPGTSRPARTSAASRSAMRS